jgi:aspartokinase
MKFGGTSMGSAERIKVAARLTAEQHSKRPVAIVVSAMSKITDLLLDSMRRAESGDEAGLDASHEPMMTHSGRARRCRAASRSDCRGPGHRARLHRA